MKYTLVSLLLSSFSFFMTISAAQKEPKTFIPWTAEQFRTADAEALHKRSEELAEIFGLKDNPQKEIELKTIMHDAIKEPENIEIINYIYKHTSKSDQHTFLCDQNKLSIVDHDK